MMATHIQGARENRPLSGTVDFLNRARLCRGPTCLSSNRDGLYRVPDMFKIRPDMCDICAVGEPEIKKDLPEAQKPAKAKTQPKEITMSENKSVRFFSNLPSTQPRKVSAQPVKPIPTIESNPLRDKIQALVRAEIDRVLPGLVAAEFAKLAGGL